MSYANKKKLLLGLVLFLLFSKTLIVKHIIKKTQYYPNSSCTWVGMM